MEKIAIVGSPGAGKTMLANELSPILKIKAYHLDRFFWQRNWIKESKDNRIDIMQQIIQEKQWIIEGTYIHSTDLHLIAADTIIFLDAPSLVCLLRLIKRYRKDYDRPRRDIPEGCKDELTVYLMLKVLSFPHRERKTLMKKLSDFETKEIIWLQSKKEVRVFLKDPNLYAYNYKRSVKVRSVFAEFGQAIIIIFSRLLQRLFNLFPRANSHEEVLDIHEQNLAGF